MASISVAGDSSGSITIAAPSAAGSGTLTLPVATDTLVGKATTDTLTNKSIAATQLTGTIAAAALPAGSVLQVVQGTKLDSATTTSTAFGDITGLSVSITPRSTANKILVLATLGSLSNTVGNNTINLLRDSTTIAQPSTGTVPGTINHYPSATGLAINSNISWLDSPSSVSSITYKFQWKVDGGTGNLNKHPTNANYNSVSSITVMEIQG